MELDNLSYYQFCFTDSEWYESPSHYHPDAEFLQIICAILPPNWKLMRNGVWFHLHPNEMDLPTQGWKIHVSATPSNCRDILCRVVEFCVTNKLSFKCILDTYLLRMMLSKGGSRESSGKFITIYPKNEDEFKYIIQDIYNILNGFSGSYILSDRRYLDSGVVYYRYGGIKDWRTLIVTGEYQHLMRAPSGEKYPDIRVPYWICPPWTSDPFEQAVEDTDMNPTLKDGRYLIERVLHFSVTGGVYTATDTSTNATVLIKEARPNTGFENEDDATSILRKEFRLLQKLQQTGFTPIPIDLFSDWEHLFLVEEYIPGINLGYYTICFSPLLRVYPKEEMKLHYLHTLKQIWARLAQGVAQIHECGIACSDLSLQNIIINESDPDNIHFVDLEAFWEEGNDKALQLFTPGFASPTHKTSPCKEDDYYALGALMLGTLFPINNILELDPSANKVFVEAFGDEIGLSKSWQKTILRCLSSNAEERLTPSQLIDKITTLRYKKQDRDIATKDVISERNLDYLCGKIVDYIIKNANHSDNERLFPADPRLFYTNPLSIAYGATGIAYALSLINGEVPQQIISWILAHPIDQEHYPPGLYMGLAGIAWGLWEVGLEEVALHILRLAENHPLLWDDVNVFYGAAGYGLACLHFYHETRDGRWLKIAEEIGCRLLDSKLEDENGNYYWPSKDGQTELGYANGASGIALFCLYLSLSNKDKRFLKLGQQALAFDLSFISKVEEGHFSISRGKVGAFENVFTHYWFDGSAGIASVLVRYWACTKDPQYLHLLEQLAPDTFRKIAAFPGLFRGLAGFGNFLLDAYQFTQNKCYLYEAQRVVSGIELFKMNRPTGIAFPGEQLYRLSTDFGTGSSGIALLFHRMIQIGQHSCNYNFNFCLDYLLDAFGLEEPRND